MKLMARIGNAAEPASARWKDQFERIVEMLHEAQKTVIALHEQQTKDA